MFNFKNLLVGLFLFIALFLPPVVLGSSSPSEASGHSSVITFLFLAILLISAKIGGIVEKLGQPAVIGEIGAGIVLSMIGFLGLREIGLMKEDQTLGFIAQLGAVILFFQIGLESNIRKIAKVGVSAFFVSLIGVIVPFSIGFTLGKWLFPDAEFFTYLFLGACLVETSVGITASVFQQMNMLKSRACQTVLGAAVIDDVLGLIILTAVSAIVVGDNLNAQFFAIIFVKVFGFLAGAIILGNILAKYLSKFFSMINTGTGMKLALALSFALSYAYLASLVGLAPVVGAFAAGLILDAVHFNSFDLPQIAYDLKEIKGFDKEDRAKINGLIDKHKHGHVEDLTASIGLLFVPVFFASIGLQIDFASLLNPSLYIYALIISASVICGKLVSGIAASGSYKEKLLVGVAMIPQGEVGLIFASIGKALGAINNELFSVIILVILINTFLAPTLIKILLNRFNRDPKFELVYS